MFEAVEKLKNEKKKLTGERTDIDTEINRIDTAIEKFEEGIQILSGNDKPRSASAEIEVILKQAKKPMHVREIHAALVSRQFSVALQSVSATLQVAAKKRQKYRRVAPATFALLEARNKNSGNKTRSAAK